MASCGGLATQCHSFFPKPNSCKNRGTFPRAANKAGPPPPGRVCRSCGTKNERHWVGNPPLSARAAGRSNQSKAAEGRVPLGRRMPSCPTKFRRSVTAARDRPQGGFPLKHVLPSTPTGVSALQAGVPVPRCERRTSWRKGQSRAPDQTAWPAFSNLQTLRPATKVKPNESGSPQRRRD